MYTVSCFSPANVAGVANILPIDITFLTLLAGNISVHLYFLFKDTYISTKKKWISIKAKGCCCCKKMNRDEQEKTQRLANNVTVNLEALENEKP